tara:strand:- start:469 stop:1257 length:789 start_codon:yes stop_codon:yes gene_type:complete
MSDFANKSVVVTGGAKGIGSGIVRAFAMAGARVACVDTDEVAGQQISGEAEGYSGDIRFYKVDVSEGAECASLCKSVISDFGSIDVLCNNVGIQPTSSYVAAHELPDEMWDQIIDVNLKSHFLMSKYSLPHMIKAKSGVIINTASVQGLQSAAGVSAYAASKGGILSLTRQLALEYAKYGIRVLAVNPGTIDTPLVEEARIHTGQTKEELNQEAVKSHPVGRIGLPSDIAAAVLFLAGEQASFMTGSYINVDGGLMAKGAWA